MYITTGKNSARYTVTDQIIAPDEVRYILSDKPPTELGETVSLYTADGAMCLRTDTVADYGHPRIRGDTIILSNTPEPVPVEPLLEEAQSTKLAEINAACDAAIVTGCDVTLSDGTAGHISLSIPDQINLSSAQSAIAAGQTGYAYHLDGNLCEIYPAADVAILAETATRHVLYHQTYCNHVRAWVKRCKTVAEVEGITYGVTLPDDLAEHIAAVLGGDHA